MKLSELIEKLKAIDSKEIEVCIEDSEREDMVVGEITFKRHNCPPYLWYLLLKPEKK